MATQPPPDYYALLGVSETATERQIRDAYKRAALKTHPDRVATDAPDRPARTRRFQLVNDAYFTLSDPARRREYDAHRRLFPRAAAAASPPPPSYADPFADNDAAAAAADDDEPAQPGPAPSSWAWGFFARPDDAPRPDDAQFEDVFEEMMRDEGMAEGDAADGPGRPTGRFWALLGGLSGAALGFIVANAPGMLAGAVAGNRLGAVRDAKGKSVYAVFQELPQDDRARLLSQLAARVFSHAVGV